MKKLAAVSIAILCLSRAGAAWADDGGTDGGSDGGTCPSAVDASSIPAWKPPTVNATACTPADIAALTTKFNDQNATFTDIYNSITTAACKTCVFSNVGDANWQPIVWQPNMAADNAFVNFGACYATTSGGSAACGKAEQDDELCYESACPDACTDQQSCIDAASTGTCSTYEMEITTGCPADTSALDMACGDGIATIVAVCGGGSPAGAEGGVTPEGDGGAGASAGSSGGGNDGGDTGASGSTSSSGCSTTESNADSSLIAMFAVGAAVMAGAARRKNKKR